MKWNTFDILPFVLPSPCFNPGRAAVVDVCHYCHRATRTYRCPCPPTGAGRCFPSVWAGCNHICNLLTLARVLLRRRNSIPMVCVFLGAVGTGACCLWRLVLAPQAIVVGGNTAIWLTRTANGGLTRLGPPVASRCLPWPHLPSPLLRYPPYFTKLLSRIKSVEAKS